MLKFFSTFNMALKERKPLRQEASELFTTYTDVHF